MSEQMNDIRRQAEEAVEVADETPKTLVERSFYQIPENFTVEKHAGLKQLVQTSLDLCMKHGESLNATGEPFKDETGRSAHFTALHTLRIASNYNATAIKEFNGELSRLASYDAAIEAWSALTPEQQEEQKQIIAELRALIMYRNYIVMSMKLATGLIEDKVPGEVDHCTEQQILHGIFDVKNEQIKELFAKVVRPCWLRQYVQAGRPNWLSSTFDPADFDKQETVN